MHKEVRSVQNDSLHAALFWACVLAIYFGAIFLRGTTMTGDGPVHWSAAVYVGSCQLSFMELIQIPGIPSGPVPYLIWGNIGKFLGYHPVILRAVCTIVSLSFAFIYWNLLRKKVKSHYVVMMFLLSYVYFFGPSHSIMTDNFGLLFLVIFYALFLNDEPLSAPKGMLCLLILILALYSRIWYVILPGTYILLSVMSAAFRQQRPNLFKTVLCVLGISSMLLVVFYWGAFVHPPMQEKHHIAVTLWLPVLVISVIGAYLFPLVFLMQTRREALIISGLIAPLFLGLFITPLTMRDPKPIGGIVQNMLSYAGNFLFGTQYAELIFLPFYIVGLIILANLIVIAYSEMREIDVWSASPIPILSVTGLGFLGANMLVPFWSERYLSPFFICLFPFIPILIKRWKRVLWAWLSILFIIALSHLVVQSVGYKRAKILTYKNTQTTLRDLQELYMMKVRLHGGEFTEDDKIKKALSCLSNDQ